MGTLPTQAARRYRPPSFLDIFSRMSATLKLDEPTAFELQSYAKELDLAMRTVFDGVYLLENVVGVNVNALDADAGTLTDDVTALDAAVTAVQAEYVAVRPAAAGKRVAWGSSTVTGSLTDIATGLATVEQVVATIQSSAAINEWVTTALNATPGEIDLYVWRVTGVADTTPIASITGRVVRWLAVGT